ncbi:Uncharacterized protein APZ42_014359 [Daphnia magna]|uniref:Uncharacterized protein n=1 Tax=Daphnia magna TaxID=35525 RepID=A0A162Q7Y6_9CRUS|nr:Uncharacterized protein APZ42_014359 [Daphnia magna]
MKISYYFICVIFQSLSSPLFFLNPCTISVSNMCTIKRTTTPFLFLFFFFFKTQSRYQLGVWERNVLKSGNNRWMGEKRK